MQGPTGQGWGEKKKRERREQDEKDRDEEVGKRWDVMVTEKCSLKGRKEKQAGCGHAEKTDVRVNMTFSLSLLKQYFTKNVKL